MKKYNLQKGQFKQMDHQLKLDLNIIILLMINHMQQLVEHMVKKKYWIDIDLFYNNQISELTLQLDFRKNGKVIIDDL